MATYSFDVPGALHVLRVEQEGYAPTGQSIWACELAAGGQMIFPDKVLLGPPRARVDEAALVAVATMTALPRDIGEEVFADYTPEQIAWRDAHAEALAALVVDEDAYSDADPVEALEHYRVSPLEEGEPPSPFTLIGAMELSPEETEAL